jgi:hypothetical protein
VLHHQLEDFTSREQLAGALLGLLAFHGRVAAVSLLERKDGGVAPEDPIVDFFLGVISSGRTLRAALGAVAPGGEARSGPRESAPPAGLLR